MIIKENISLRYITTFKVGGEARYFIQAKTTADLIEAIEYARDRRMPFFVLGSGSNVIFSDVGFPGLVIQLASRGISYDKKSDGEVWAEVEAGENWDEFVADTVSRGLWGLENLSGIPGTVGAVPVQNIGAYGAEVKDSIVGVEAIDTRTLSIVDFTKEECGFSYRDSFFKTPEGKNFIITKVTFRLKKGGTPNIGYKDLNNFFRGNLSPSLREVRRAVLDIRKGKFPELARYGTAGSFFKNPIISQGQYEELSVRFSGLPGFMYDDGRVKIPLAWILDNVLKLKGAIRGNAGVWKSQPLVLFAEPNTKSKEVIELAEEIMRSVLTTTGIKIEPEVNIL